MALLAWAVATDSWVRAGAGAVVLLAACVVGIVGGALHDTRHPGALGEEARAAVHGSTRRVALQEDVSTRQVQDARVTDGTRRSLLETTARTSATPLAPLAALVLLAEGIALLAAQSPLYPMSHAGQLGSERVLGAGVVLTLGSLRVLMGPAGRHLPSLALMLVTALALLAGGVLLHHDSRSAPLVESGAAILAVVAVLVCVASPRSR
jgi:hypothetical protein